MALPPRIEYPGAFYHVLIRGNQRQDIFFDDKDRTVFLDRVARYKEKMGFSLYGYVLMTNHVHLLVETAATPLSKIMQVINFTYTQYVNKKYGKIGRLLQGRYEALLCDRDEYLLALVRYIHLNPVRARIVADPITYKWSRHSAYLGKGQRNGLVDTEKVLRLFSENIGEAKKKYARFVEEALGAVTDNSFYEVAKQQILGDENFIHKVSAKIEMKEPLKKPLLKELVKAVTDVTGVSEEELISRGRKENIVFARGLLAAASRESGWPLVKLKPLLKRDLSRLSRMAKVSESERGRKELKRVFKSLNARKQA